VNQIPRERLNRSAPNSHGRHVWSLARTSLNVKVKGQGYQAQKTCAVHSHHPWQRLNGTRSPQITSVSSRWDHSVASRGDFGGLCAVYVWSNILSSIFVFVLLFVNQISREWLNTFVPNSQCRRVWSLAQTSLNVKVKGQSHQRQKCAVHSHHPR